MEVLVFASVVGDVKKVKKVDFCARVIVAVMGGMC